MNEAQPIDTEYQPPSAVEAISRAEIDVAIATARRYPPRELAKVKLKMISFATLDEETAQACFYTLPRGGKNIQGPSVRLAEIAVSCYGNLRAGTRIINTVTDGENPHVVVQAVAMDLENNITVSIEKRRRITKKKSATRIDEDDINLATNACSAIAFRDSVFKIIPGALVKPAFEQARKVAIGDARTLSDRRAKCIDAFGKMGVTKERLLAKLERKSLEEIDLTDIETLLGLFNAIRENEEGMTVDAVFPLVQSQTKSPVIPGTQPKPPTGPVNAPQTSQGPGAPTIPTPGVNVPAAPSSAQPAPKESVVTKPAETPKQAEEKAEADAGLAPAQTQAPTQAPQTPSPPPPAEPQEPFKPNAQESDELQNVRLMMYKNRISEPQVLSWAIENKLARVGQKLSDLSTGKLKDMLKNWDTILPKIRAK